jgi:hypothetical protein
MQRTSKNTEGFLFPIPHHLIERLFSGEKDVFVKLSRAAYRFLNAGSILVFYDSDSKKIVGEAKVKKIVYAEPSIIWEEFGPRIFLQKREFDDYVMRSPLGPRKAKAMTAFELEKFSKQGYPKKPRKRVTPSGYYLPISSF